MIRIEPDKNRVRWTGKDGKHYIGRVLRDSSGMPIGDARDETRRNVLIFLDYNGGHVFVDCNILRPHPSEKIPEPTSQGAGR